MIRYGASAKKMQPISAREVFTLHLKLLIIMAKASLKGNPLGDYRKTAIKQAARFVFSAARYRAKQLEKAAIRESLHPKLRNWKMDADHFFLMHIQLLAVMANAWAKGKAPGRYRKEAMIKNVDSICAHLSRRQNSADTVILKVA